MCQKYDSVSIVCCMIADWAPLLLPSGDDSALHGADAAVLALALLVGVRQAPVAGVALAVTHNIPNFTNILNVISSWAVSLMAARHDWFIKTSYFRREQNVTCLSSSPSVQSSVWRRLFPNHWFQSKVKCRKATIPSPLRQVDPRQRRRNYGKFS